VLMGLLGASGRHGHGDFRLAKFVKSREIIWVYFGSPLAERRLGGSLGQAVDGHIALCDCD